MTKNEKFIDLNVWLGIILAIGGSIIALLFEYESKIVDALFTWGPAALFVADYIELKKRKLQRPHFAWAALLPPVYLWKRSTLLNRDRKTFWVYMTWIIFWVVFVFSFLMMEDSQLSNDVTAPIKQSASAHTLSNDDRQVISDWLQAMSYEFASVNLSSASIPVYYCDSNGGLLGFISFENTEYIFATSVNDTRMTTCGLFSEFSYIDGTILLAKCPDASGSYDQDGDYFEFEQDINGCGFCGMGASLQGHYKRLATALCEMQSNGEIDVAQVFSK